MVWGSWAAMFGWVMLLIVHQTGPALLLVSFFYLGFFLFLLLPFPPPPFFFALSWKTWDLGKEDAS